MLLPDGLRLSGLDAATKKLLAAQGTNGFFVYSNLCRLAYDSTGYYLPWCCGSREDLPDEVLCGVVGAKSVHETVKTCLQIGLFDNKLFVQWKILTNRQLQESYIKSGKEIKPEHKIPGLGFDTQKTGKTKKMPPNPDSAPHDHDHEHDKIDKIDKNHINHINHINPNRYRREEETKQYAVWKQLDFWPDVPDFIIELMVGVIYNKDNVIYIHGKPIPAEIVKERFLELTADHISHVMECLFPYETKMKNPKAYYRTALYNAKVDYERAAQMSEMAAQKYLFEQELANKRWGKKS